MTRLTAGLLAAAGILVLGACQQASAAPPADTAQAQAPKQTPAERGRYLVDAIAGCDDCHTPKNMGPNGPEPDMTRRLSGHPENMKLGEPPKPAGRLDDRRVTRPDDLGGSLGHFVSPRT